MDIYTERSFPSGGWRVSAVIDGYRVSRLYLGYNKREAVAEFRRDVAS